MSEIDVAISELAAGRCPDGGGPHCVCRKLGKKGQCVSLSELKQCTTCDDDGMFRIGMQGDICGDCFGTKILDERVWAMRVTFPWDGSSPVRSPVFVRTIGGYIKYLAKRMGCDRERFVVESETPGRIVVALENPSESEVEKLRAIMEEPVSLSIQQVAARGER